MDALIQALVAANFAPERIIPRAPMARYTTFRVGGPADVLVNIADAREIATALRAARHAGVPTTIIGNGSNLLVRDGGIRGLVIRIAGDCAGIRREENKLYAKAGISMSAAAQFALSEGLSGLAEMAGIPGTLGGGVIMNAGAYGGEIAQVCQSVDVMVRDGSIITVPASEMGFSYRHSYLEDTFGVVVGAVFALTKREEEEVRGQMQELLKKRKASQPLEYPSAGSAFKRPVGGYAAALIDETGLKGYRVGDAAVSEKHAGFVVNLGCATAQDVINLLESVSDQVFDRTGIRLEPEVRIW